MRAGVRAACVAAPAVAATARNLRAPLEVIVGRIPDDAFFYLVIARNIASGRGVTFDGRDPTTGFHALWLGIVSVLPSGAGVRGLLLLHGIVVVAAVLLADAVLARLEVDARLRGVGAAAMGVWGASAYGIGMETTLVAALVLGLLLVDGAVWRFVLGFLVGVARIDMAPLAVAGGRWGVAGALTGMGATFGFNAWLTGDPISTSARIKGLGSVAERLARLDPEGVWRHTPGPLVAAMVVLGVGVASARWPLIRPSATFSPQAGRRPGGRMDPESSHPSSLQGLSLLQLGVVCALALLQLGASYLLNNLVGPWYFVPAAWLCVTAALASAGRVRYGAWLVAAMVLACLRGTSLPAPGLHTTVIGFANALRDVTPPDARLVAEDFPGMLAWFSERDVLPADGLAAAPGYLSALAEGDAMRWWLARGATHYVVTRRRADWLRGEPREDKIAPPFLPVPASSVALNPALRGPLVTDAGGRVFALYRL